MFRNSTDLKESWFLIDLTIHYRYHRPTVVQIHLVFHLFKFRTDNKKYLAQKYILKIKITVVNVNDTRFFLSSKQCRKNHFKL